MVDRDHVALLDPRAEAYHAAIAPELGADGFAREHRRREPPGHRGQPGRIIAAYRLEQRVAGDPEGRKAMQHRAREAGGLGEFRIGMQRVGVAGQPVDQRHFRPGRQSRRCRPARARAAHAAAALSRSGAAEAAVAAAERGLLQGCEQAAARLVADLALRINQRALAFALVDHVENAGAPDHRALRRDRRVQHEALLAMHHLLPGDADLRPAQPIGGVALHHGEGRQHFEIFLVDEGELVGIERVLAETEAERIEHAILRAVRVLDVGDLQGQEFFGV